MIEAEHNLVIDTDIDNVWNYVQDISKWALLFPGCRECEVIDDHNSKWIIKVGAGGLIKTVNVLVHIDEWAGPERVDFTYKLESEPVVGSGSYVASKQGDQATAVKMHLRVEGSGQTAPMWEAVSKPLLPQMAKSFSGKLKNEIEAAAGIAVTPKPSIFVVFIQWLKSLWQGIFASSPKQ